MIAIAGDIVNCLGFETVKSLSWDDRGDETGHYDSQLPTSDGRKWGLTICRPPCLKPSRVESENDQLFGMVGPLQSDHVQEEHWGVLLRSVHDPDIALSILALACGLSIVTKAELELGDTMVVAGANLLARSVLVSAEAQGARTACLIPAQGVDDSYLVNIQRVSDESIPFEIDSDFDAKLDGFIFTGIGKTVFVDATGLSSLIHPMISRLTMFGTLILCRQESNISVPIDLYRDVHRKSAQIKYWAGPENMESGIVMREHCQHAVRMSHWSRIT